MGVKNFIGDLKVLYLAATTKPPSSEAIGSLPLLVQQHASSNPNRIALLCEDEQVTWQELNDQANRVAAKLEADGITKGDCVSLFMQNRIEFVSCMLGIQKLGAVVGMINTNLSTQQLVHCINLTESKKCIFGEELTQPLSEVTAELNLRDGSDYLFVSDTAETPAPNWAVTLDIKDDSIQASNPDVTSTLTMGDVALYLSLIHI